MTSKIEVIPQTEIILRKERRKLNRVSVDQRSNRQLILSSVIEILVGYGIIRRYFINFESLKASLINVQAWGYINMKLNNSEPKYEVEKDKCIADILLGTLPVWSLHLLALIFDKYSSFSSNTTIGDHALFR